MSLDNTLILCRSKVELQVQESHIYKGIKVHGPAWQERKDTK